MEFKQYWKINKFETRSVIAIIVLMFFNFLTFIYHGWYEWAWTPFVVVFGVLLMCLIASLPRRGQFTNTIRIDGEGIQFTSKYQKDLYFAWNEVVKIRRIGNNPKYNCIYYVFNDKKEQIWFYGSNQIEQYIFEIYPTSKDLMEVYM